ncbi:DUF6442 family protein [Lacticigenium naphthae]|uniref:DUF6442 family protein n=1 Tax=Lacticigenium naphthae TaxID=515351 RepID=UPI0003F82326|nr:DUF6442 family protein [Lacticigenium naphthae]
MHKKDEMEQKIADKAVKITWVVTILALFIIGGIQSLLNSGERSILLLIAILSTTFLVSVEQYYLSKLNEDKKFIKMISAALILSVILLGSGWFVSR